MSQIIAMSKPTKNVLTETTPDNFIFHSNYDTLKYYVQGIKRVTVNFADYYDSDTDPFGDPRYYHYKIVTVAHNLGYIPYFVGYFPDFPNTGDMIQLPLFHADSFYFTYFSVYADSTNIYFMAQLSNTANSGSGYADYGYRVFRNDLGL